MRTYHNHQYDQITRQEVARGVRTLSRSGERATIEFYLEVAKRIGGMPAILGLFAEYERRLSSETLTTAGGDRSPPHLTLVPQDLWQDDVS